MMDAPAGFKIVDDDPANRFEPENAASLLAEPIEPRGWLLATLICRRFVTVLAAFGGAGKTTLLFTWALSLATGRPLIGLHVHHRARVLLVTLEDGREELKRRLKAACIHHGVDPAELDGWLFVKALSGEQATLSTIGANGAMIDTGAAAEILDVCKRHRIDAAMADPFVKFSGAPENDNQATDFVCRLVSRIAETANVAAVVAHHFRKGVAPAGDIDSARGARALIDAARIALTLLPMSPVEADTFGVSEHERRRYVRMDDGKLNLTPADKARWFRLASVQLDNATTQYPRGDNVQTVEPWTPPDTFDGLSTDMCRRIIAAIDAGMENGERYTDRRSRGNTRWAGMVVVRLAGKTEKQAAEVLKTWLRTGVLFAEKYHSDEQRKEARGLFANPEKLPGSHDE